MFEVGIAVAGSVGSTIAGAIWNSVLPGLLNKNVPGQINYLYITSNIKHALALPADQYKGVVVAYDQAMRILSIAAVCMGIISFICALLLKGGALGGSSSDDKMEESSTNAQNDRIELGKYINRDNFFTSSLMCFLIDDEVNTLKDVKAATSNNSK